ncbi:MAG: ATPase, T2SS/T4P/T4SS family [Verrucomicrobiota bacterium]
MNDEYVVELLVNQGFITSEDAMMLRVQASQANRPFEDEVIAQGVVSRDDVMLAVANDNNMDFLPEIEPDTIDEEVVSLVDDEIAKRYHIFPIKRMGSMVSIAIPDPLDFETLDSLRYLLKFEIEPIVVPQDKINEAIGRYYGNLDQAGMVNGQADAVELRGVGEGEDEQNTEGDAPIIKMVYGMILDAHRLKGSDIHLEPLEKRLRLRYRIDGKLQEMRDPPKKLQSSIISRIKIMANMSIAEKRLPQDGRISLAMQDGTQVDLRVSTIPSVHGESIVMRILDKKALVLGLPELGYLSDDQAKMERILGLADGIFLVTGPTGSGKSTTLYACLNMLNKSDRKLITVEDPVEYEMAGINQVPVNHETGMTFAAALRAMLRQAPNIIMVGEIRDKETATIAINASLTGHLVFSTLHTNDAPSAITRLCDIGVKPFLVSSSVRAVMAQRLVRQICPKCTQPYMPTDVELRSLNLDASRIAEANFKHGSGCESCRNTGYKGRLGIFEIFSVDDEIRQMINDDASISQLRQKARDLGMRTLREDGIRKAVAGMTTPEEVISITMGDKE